MENRTPDLVIANDALYQLSYDPKRRAFPTTPVATAQEQRLFLEAKHTAAFIGGDRLEIFGVSLASAE